MNQEEIGKYISKKRNEKDLTQEQLAEKLGVTRASISKWERGINLPDKGSLIPLCDILNISIDELLTADNRKIQKCDNVLNIINLYEKEYKRKTNIILVMIIIFMILVCGILIYSINIKNFSMKNINHTDGTIEVYGKVFENKGQQLIYISDIEYNGILVGTDLEVCGNKGIIRVKSEDKELYSKSTLSDETQSISEFLQTLTLEYQDNDNNIEQKEVVIQIYENEKIVYEYSFFI